MSAQKEKNIGSVAASNIQNFKVSKKDLPLHCPMDNMTLWNLHPKVYLPIDESGEERCPYCGTLYSMKE